MLGLMDKTALMRTVADVESAESIWYENISGDADRVSFSLPESGSYCVILVKLDAVHKPRTVPRNLAGRKISPKVRALRGAAKLTDDRDYKAILADALVERHEALG